MSAPDMNMDKMDLLLCTDEHGQPVLDKNGKLIYYCAKTGSLTVLDDECSIATASTSEGTVKDMTGRTANEDKFNDEMTIKLLEIIKSKFHLLSDKMHSKKKIWIDIGIEMQNNGNLATGTKSGEKCHQRWRNLEKAYHGHLRYMKTTGTGKKKPPKYFDEIHDIIGEKYSSQPVNVLDSLNSFDAAATASNMCNKKIVNDKEKNDEELVNISASENAKENENHNLKSIFDDVKRSVRPKKYNLSNILKELHAQDIQIENERFEKFQALVVDQNNLKKRMLEQRDEFLNIMKDFINLKAQKKSKKRKHYSSDSDSSFN